MRPLINQYSFVVAGAILWLALAVFIVWRGRGLPLAVRLGAPVALALGLGIAWALFRPSAGGVGPATAADLDAALAAARRTNRPLLVELYSDY